MATKVYYNTLSKTLFYRSVVVFVLIDGKSYSQHVFT